jgi:hypothetical protein
MVARGAVLVGAGGAGTPQGPAPRNWWRSSPKPQLAGALDGQRSA